MEAEKNYLGRFDITADCCGKHSVAIYWIGHFRDRSYFLQIEKEENKEWSRIVPSKVVSLESLKEVEIWLDNNIEKPLSEVLSKF